MTLFYSNCLLIYEIIMNIIFFSVLKMTIMYSVDSFEQCRDSYEVMSLIDTHSHTHT